jgi:hypothetical protein
MNGAGMPNENEFDEVRVIAKAVDGHFAVSVADNTGPGIPEHERTRIFEQFHQIDNSNTKVKGGTGLGLTIAKQIVEMHGGRIWVESTLGKGSTFQMELPTPRRVPQEGNLSKDILLIEDQQDLRRPSPSAPVQLGCQQGSRRTHYPPGSRQPDGTCRVRRRKQGQNRPDKSAQRSRR